MQQQLQPRYRQKQLAELHAEEKDLLESISDSKAAIVALSKHHPNSMLQIPQSQLLGVTVSVQHEHEKHSSILETALSAKL